VIVGVAICPPAPLLARELTGLDPVIPELRQACAAAAERLVRSGPDVIAVIGPGRRTAVWPTDGRLNLAAFGPATVADIQTWSGLTRLREVTGRLELRAYRGPADEVLLDLADKELPPEDVPAPPRFLPEYDNLLLSHADRSRVIPHRRPVPLPPGHGATGGTLLVDGRWQASWKIVRGGLEIEPFIPLSASDRDAIAAEGERLLGFAAPAIAVRDVRFVPVRSG